MDMKQTDSGAPLTAKDEEIIHAASPRDPHILKGVKSTERVIDLSMHIPEVAARRGLPAAILAVKNHTGAAWASVDMASAPKAEARIYASSSRPRDAWVVRLPRPLTDAEGDAIYDWMNGKEDAERDSVRANQAQSNVSLDERIAMGEEQEIAAMRRVVSAPPSPAPDRAEVLRLAREMNRRFTSMNSVPVDKATVPTAEWAELRAALIKLLGVE